jgi:hypothetical protein
MVTGRKSGVLPPLISLQQSTASDGNAVSWHLAPLPQCDKYCADN